MPHLHSELVRKVGTYDFRAYTQRTHEGLNQGFVLVHHYTSAGVVTSLVCAGEPTSQSSRALAKAVEKVEDLSSLAINDALPMNTDEQSI